MRTLKKSMVSYDKFCSILETLIYNYDNMPEVEKLSGYDSLLDSAEETDMSIMEKFKGLPIPDDTSDEINEVSKEIIIFGTELMINNYFGNKTYKNGFCLKTKMKGSAVQMRNNDDMLGFISELTDEPRFVMVDFGDEEAVKIDVDELNFG